MGAKSTVFKILRIIFLLILMLFFVAGSQFFVFGLNARTALLDPTTYLNAFEKNDAYNAVTDIYLSSMLGGEEAKAKGIPVDIKAVVKEFLTPEFFKEKTKILLTNIFAYVNGQTGELNLKIPIGKDFGKNLLTKVAQEMIDKLPPCNINDIVNIVYSGQLSCIPPGMTASQMVDLFTEQQGGAQIIPSEINLEESGFSGMRESLKDARDFTQAATFWLTTTGIILLAIIGIVILITKLICKSTKSMLKWIGAYFFAAGLIGIIIGMIASAAIRQIVLQEIAVPEEVGKILAGVLTDIIAPVIGNSIICFAACLVFGIILLVVGIFVIKGKPEPKKGGAGQESEGNEKKMSEEVSDQSIILPESAKS